ncbi:MAG: hypothetical protein N2316_03840 [Spirochaetes bacterium]|nr:hypothetical protein [Spirochaetota bacterium]
MIFPLCKRKEQVKTNKFGVFFFGLISFFLFFMPKKLFSVPLNYAIGGYLGIAPSLGCDLQSMRQYYFYNSQSGIDGLNRTQEGYETKNGDRLLGLVGGISGKILIFENYQFRIAFNYASGILGGEGTTLYGSTPDLLEFRYSFRTIDIPFVFGIVIPFWKDIKVSFNCGTAFAYGWYTNSFTENGVTTYKGKFSGKAFPLTILLEAEYFITDKLAVTSSLSYYRGSSKLFTDEYDEDGDVDYARLNFSGYRYSIGVMYYFLSI